MRGCHHTFLFFFFFLFALWIVMMNTQANIDWRLDGLFNFIYFNIVILLALVWVCIFLKNIQNFEYDREFVF
jgi:hypothetical protein